MIKDGRHHRGNLQKEPIGKYFKIIIFWNLKTIWQQTWLKCSLDDHLQCVACVDQQSKFQDGCHCVTYMYVYWCSCNMRPQRTIQKVAFLRCMYYSSNRKLYIKSLDCHFHFSVLIWNLSKLMDSSGHRLTMEIWIKKIFLKNFKLAWKANSACIFGRFYRLNYSAI